VAILGVTIVVFGLLRLSVGPRSLAPAARSRAGRIRTTNNPPSKLVSQVIPNFWFGIMLILMLCK
jgi:hypothetical protein